MPESYVLVGFAKGNQRGCGVRSKRLATEALGRHRHSGRALRAASARVRETFDVRVTLPSGAVVQAHGASGFISTKGHLRPDWALYLDEAWRSRSLALAWPHRHVCWPDFGLPDDEDDAFDAFGEAWRRSSTGELVDIACDGGTGRTGTALACVAVLDGVPASDVVAWVRTQYHPYAVEVDEQEELIARFQTWTRQR